MGIFEMGWEKPSPIQVSHGGVFMFPLPFSAPVFFLQFNNLPLVKHVPKDHSQDTAVNAMDVMDYTFWGFFFCPKYVF